MLNKLTIKQKILLLGILPILIGVFFIFHETGEILEDKKELEKVQGNIKNIEKLSELIHELQKERGLSVGFLTSKGINFEDELTRQRIEVDKMVRMTGLPPPNNPLFLLDKLEAKRKEIDSFNIEPDKAFEYYEEVIFKYFDVLSKIIFKTNLSEIKNRLISYHRLIHAKEFLGQIRATLGAVFTSGEFDGYTIAKLGALKNSYDVSVKKFSRDASDDEKRFFNEKFSKNKDVEYIMNVIDTAFARFNKGDFKIAPELWFKKATIPINILKEVEDFSIGKIRQDAEERVNEANKQAAAIIITLFAVLIIAGTLTLLILKNTLKRFDSLYSEIISVALTKDLKYKNPKVPDDEIGHVLNVFNLCVAEIGGLIDEKERLATTDHLTKIYNRLKFNEILNYELQRAERYKHDVCLIMFDIDDFKEINDRHGHLAGDNVLIDIVNVVKGNIRGTDIFARGGGEEFVILLPETCIHRAEDAAEKLRKAIEEFDFKGLGRVTCSFGAAEFKPNDSIEIITKRADMALYMSKENGKNMVSVVRF